MNAKGLGPGDIVTVNGDVTFRTVYNTDPLTLRDIPVLERWMDMRAFERPTKVEIIKWVVRYEGRNDLFPLPPKETVEPVRLLWVMQSNNASPGGDTFLVHPDQVQP